jgi:hypothetical protein
MPIWLWLIVIVVVLAAIGVLVWWSARRPDGRSRERARGAHRASARVPTVEPTASPSPEPAPAERAGLRPLDDPDRRDYAERWDRLQRSFDDSPDLAIAEADTLARSLLEERGYPVDGPDERLVDLSIDHPEIDHYRLASAIAAEARRGDASAERLRQARVH